MKLNQLLQPQRLYTDVDASGGGEFEDQVEPEVQPEPEAKAEYATKDDFHALMAKLDSLAAPQKPAKVEEAEDEVDPAYMTAVELIAHAEKRAEAAADRRTAIAMAPLHAQIAAQALNKAIGAEVPLEMLEDLSAEDIMYIAGKPSLQKAYKAAALASAKSKPSPRGYGENYDTPDEVDGLTRGEEQEFATFVRTMKQHDKNFDEKGARKLMIQQKQEGLRGRN